MKQCVYCERECGIYCTHPPLETALRLMRDMLQDGMNADLMQRFVERESSKDGGKA